MKTQSDSSSGTEIRRSFEAVGADLEKRRAGVRSVRDLAGEEIDRPFPLILEEWSDTELDVEMARRASRINEALNLKKRINDKTGNKLLKILLAVPYLAHFVLTKPIHIIRDFSVFNHILFIRLGRIDRQLEKLRGSLADAVEGGSEALPTEQEAGE